MEIHSGKIRGIKAAALVKYFIGIDKREMPAVNTYSIVLAEDHDLFRKDLKRILARKSDLEIVGEVSDGLELIDLLKEITPHMIILDISMPNMSGIEAAREFSVKYSDISILILSMHKNIEYLQEAACAGAKGYLLKEDIDRGLFAAIETIRNGGTFFPQF